MSALKRAIVAGLEELELGDVQAAEAILLAALEDGSADRPQRCHFCPAAFEWPGLLDHHVLISHPAELVA